MPYISASIIMQLMTVVVPDARGAEEGRRVRAPQDHAVHALRHAGPRALPGARHLDRAGGAAGPGDRRRASRSASTAVVTLVTGTMFLMWLGEQITERGLGNGISIIIFAGIAAGPAAARSAARSSWCAPARCRSSLALVIVALVVAGDRRSWCSSSAASARSW